MKPTFSEFTIQDQGGFFTVYRDGLPFASTNTRAAAETIAAAMGDLVVAAFKLAKAAGSFKKWPGVVDAIPDVGQAIINAGGPSIFPPVYDQYEN